MKGLHSFLENYNPLNGDKTRSVILSNQWIYNTKDKWIELSKAQFGGDETASKNYRKDYAASIDKNQFYLKNCGFFNEYTDLNKVLSRGLSNQVPIIDFSKLPQ